MRRSRNRRTGGNRQGGTGKDGAKWRQRLEWVTCPTCRGKGTRGMDKNGPKVCGLCNGDKQIQALEE